MAKRKEGGSEDWLWRSSALIELGSMPGGGQKKRAVRVVTGAEIGVACIAQNTALA